MNSDQQLVKLPLPPEIIVHISKYLNIQDKLNLTLINKAFKRIFDNFIELDCLVLSTTESVIGKHWFYTNKLIRENDLIKLNKTIILNNLFDKHYLFLRIKRLLLKFSKPIDLNETINKFKNLEELNIYFILKSNSILSLPKLRILSISNSKINHFQINNILELETPSLSFLRCEDLNNYQFNYPGKLIYLDIEVKSMFPGHFSKKIEIFENLQFYITNRFDNHFEPNFLTKLNQLKELRFGGISSETLSSDKTIKLKEIYEYKLNLKLNNLRIFLYGIDYEYLKDLSVEQFITTQKLDLIFQYYSNTIDILSFIKQMDFNKLIAFLDSNPAISFDNIVHKFPNVQINATISTEEMLDRLFEYLSKFNNLSKMKLNLLINNQIYYLNMLPDLCKNLTYLAIDNLKINESSNLNFLYQFSKLNVLNLGGLSSLDTFRYLPNDLNYRIDFNLIYRKRAFNISHFFGIYLYDNSEFNDKYELMRYLDDICEDFRHYGYGHYHFSYDSSDENVNHNLDLLNYESDYDYY